MSDASETRNPPSVEAAPHFELRQGISFCRVADRTIFLDIVGDRYFCLSPEGERAFTRLADGDMLAADDITTLARLTIIGPLARDPTGQAIKPCSAIALPSHSLLDTNLRRPGAISLTLAGASLVRVPLHLRLFGLGRAVDLLRRRKLRGRAGYEQARLAGIAAAFARLRYLATEHDNCLTRSLAVAHRLASAGALPDLVIAVKLQPFAAHAWVQCDGWLINDRHEFVREFTPILIV